jgi:glycosyltransferase involved in cell wall biosynthesis
MTRPFRNSTPLNILSQLAVVPRAMRQHEGFCLPLIEAQSCGAPVVCSDITVLREVAGEGALLFDPQDAKALAACLEKVFNDGELRRRLALAGRQNAARFSWARAAEEMEAIFMATARL